MTNKNTNSLFDDFIIQADRALKTLVPGSSQALRKSPAVTVEDFELKGTEQAHAAGLMRINHTGEVCAQALYQGQALTAQLAEVRENMEHAAQEEVDHLDWCAERLTQLDSRPSLFNPLWYALSFGVGAAAGLAGDKWSLGFVEETENQVCKHLEEHLDSLPKTDQKSQAILTQMLIDEAHHATMARDAGAAKLPLPIKSAMTFMSLAMKKVVYKM